jgi:hypothetical protein
MPRWYAALRRKGSVQNLVDQVTQLVRTYDLGRVLPLIRFERRPVGEYYVFLGIESDTPGKLPPELQALREHPLIRALMPKPDGAGVQPFSLDQIRTMVSGEISVQEYARRLHRSILEPPLFADPFPPGGVADEAAIDDLLARSQRHDRLLAWLSAAGAGPLHAALRACQALGLDRDGSETGRILRRLRLLGHLERSADGTHWSIAPTVLTRVFDAAGEPAYVLCGGRDDALLAALRRWATVQEEPQPGGHGPARVQVTGGEPEVLAARLQESGVLLPVRVEAAANRLAEALPPLEHWQATLSTVPVPHPELYHVRRFEGEDFIDTTVHGSGFYELRPRESKSLRTPRSTYLFYDDARDCWLAGDWYGLRYLARVRAGQQCPAHYDFLSARLAIPVTWRPPELYERALVLCSGRLPGRWNNWLYYDNVDVSIATVLTTKLHMGLDEGDG